MGMWRLQVCKPVAIVIAIYDESTPYTSLETDELVPAAWESDLEAWNNYIDKTNRRIRAGLLIPGGGLLDVAWEGFLPHDTDREVIDYLELPMQTPRVLASEIIEFFETIRNGEFEPRLLSFVLDDSGSIEVKDYQAQLNLAVEILQETYPDLEVYDFRSNADEHWLRDIKVAQEEVCC